MTKPLSVKDHLKNLAKQFPDLDNAEISPHCLANAAATLDHASKKERNYDALESAVLTASPIRLLKI